MKTLRELPDEKLILTIFQSEKHPYPSLVHMDASCIVSEVEQFAISRAVCLADIINSSDGIQTGLNKLGISVDDYNRRVKGGEKFLYPLDERNKDRPDDKNMGAAFFVVRNNYNNILGLERTPPFYNGPNKGVLDYTIEDIANTIVHSGPKDNIANPIRGRKVDYALYDDFMKRREKYIRIDLRQGIDEMEREFPYRWRP